MATERSGRNGKEAPVPHRLSAIGSARRRPTPLGLAVLAALTVLPAAGLTMPAAAATGSADLSLTITHTPDSPVTGEDTTVTLTATNAGPTAAEDVVLGVSLGWYWQNVTVDHDACGVGGENQAVICPVGSLAAGASASVTITLNPYAPAVVVLPAAVASGTPDPDTGDRTASTTLIVRQGPSQAQRAVEEIYRQVLGRAASADEALFWADRWNAMDDYTQRYRVPLEIIASPEANRRRIRSTYLEVLHRAATSGDESFWLGQFAGGRTYESFEAALLGSSELLALAGSPDAAIVAIHQRLLGRTPAPADLDTARRRLAAGWSSADLATAIQATTEARDVVIADRIGQVLGRAPHDFDRLVWLSALAEGSTHDEQWAQLYTTVEFLQQFPYDYYYGF